MRALRRARWARETSGVVALAVHLSRPMRQTDVVPVVNLLLAHNPLEDVSHLVEALAHEVRLARPLRRSASDIVEIAPAYADHGIRERRAYDVVTTHHGAAAVRAARERAPDVVVVHQDAPGLAAMLTQRALAAAGFRTPVVVVAPPHDLAWLARVTGTPFRLAHPVDADELIALIERAVDGIPHPARALHGSREPVDLIARATPDTEPHRSVRSPLALALYSLRRTR